MCSSDLKLLPRSYQRLLDSKWQVIQENILKITAPSNVLASEQKAIAWTVARISEVESSGAYTLMRAAAKKGGIKYYDE